MITNPSPPSASSPPAPGEGAAPFVLELPRSRGAFDELLRPALFHLIGEARRGFPEAAHVMPFPRAQGFSDPREVHRGDLFARALVADALASTDRLALGRLAPLVADEAAYLRGARRRSGVGGWSYFPTLPELPPDADDLAQAMQLFLSAGRRDWIAELCAGPLAVLLADGRHDDGSFETWIVPARERSAEEELQALWAAKAWGRGADTEVVANLLYTLHLYDHDSFAREIAAGRRWLASRQREDGSFSSGWYQGPFYGTYVALRLLASGEAATAAERNAVAAALAFLRRAQRSDGGWGEIASTPIETALALLGLAGAAPADRDPADAARALAAAGWLAAQPLSGGAWAGSPFIRMELGRAAGRIHQVLTYQSSTVSTAFVLKAAVAWRELTIADSADAPRKEIRS